MVRWLGSLVSFSGPKPCVASLYAMWSCSVPNLAGLARWSSPHGWILTVPWHGHAEALEQEVVKSNAASEERLHRHHRWAQATTIIQISIALAAITILTRRKWMQRLSMAAAAIGVVLAGLAFFGV